LLASIQRPVDRGRRLGADQSHDLRRAFALGGYPADRVIVESLGAALIDALLLGSSDALALALLDARALELGDAGP